MYREQTKNIINPPHRPPNRPFVQISGSLVFLAKNPLFLVFWDRPKVGENWISKCAKTVKMRSKRCKSSPQAEKKMGMVHFSKNSHLFLGNRKHGGFLLEIQVIGISQESGSWQSVTLWRFSGPPRCKKYTFWYSKMRFLTVRDAKFDKIHLFGMNNKTQFWDFFGVKSTPFISSQIWLQGGRRWVGFILIPLLREHVSWNRVPWNWNRASVKKQNRVPVKQVNWNPSVTSDNVWMMWINNNHHFAWIW